MHLLFRRVPETSGFRPVCKIFIILSLFAATLTIGSTSLFAQALSIRREVSLGSTQNDLGNLRVIVSSTGEIITAYPDVMDSGLNRLQLGWFNKQLTQLKSNITTINTYRVETNSLIESADQGYVVVGSAEMQKVYNGPINYEVKLGKVANDGMFRFDKSFGGNGDDIGIGVQQTADGGYLIIANSLSTDADIQNTTGKSQVWLAKIDWDGNKAWGKLLTNTHAHEAADFIKTPDGNFAICGKVTATTSLGPTAGTGEAFIMKFTEDGTLIWQTYTGGTSAEDKFERMTLDAAGNFILAGSTESTPGSAAGNHGGTDGWIAKANQQGTVYYNMLMGGSGEDILRAITISPTGLITAGGSTTSRDGDMQDNVYGHTIWVTSLSTDYNTSRHGFFGHPVSDASFVQDLTTGPDGTIYGVATSNAGNPFVKNPIGQNDGWLFGLGEKNIFTGTAYFDENKNGRKEPSERFFTGGKFEISKPAIPGSTEYLLSHNGNFEAWLDTGAYVARLILDQPYYRVVPQSYSFRFTGYNISDSVAIALVADTVVKDLEVEIIPNMIPRPGFGVSYTLKYKNQGTTTINDARLKFVKDSRVEMLSVMPSAAVTNGDTTSWLIGSLNPLDSGHITINGRIQQPPFVNNGDTLNMKAIVYEGEEIMESSTKALTEIVSGSYDPNDKTELHGGLFPASLVNSGRLTYLIRFQNTGTDTAFNVFIRDTLHANVDPSTLQMISASHNFMLTLKNQNQLEWKFNNILLPDSNVNEKASHGYVLFCVKPDNTLSTGDIIDNTASIYFDFNLPVVTNTTSTRIVDLALPKPILSGLADKYCQTAGAQSVQITNLLQAGQAVVKAKLNNQPLTVNSVGQLTLLPASLAAGVHTLEVSFASTAASASLIAQFSIAAPAEPVVDLASSIGIVNFNVSAVTLTATPVAGSGATPSYAFSADRNFTSLLQSQGLANSVSFNSRILTMGDNWLYVRMTSNEICSSSATAIDSVKIVRSSVTSIIDVDFANTPIIAYPVPFNTELTIKGLQVGSPYSIQILDAKGRIFISENIERRSTYTFSDLNLMQGIYYMRLYDKKKKRLIGTMKVVRL